MKIAATIKRRRIYLDKIHAIPIKEKAYLQFIRHFTKNILKDACFYY